MKKILIATDGSECSQRGVNMGKHIAECMGSEVKIINVVPQTTTPVLSDSGSKKSIDKALEDYQLEKEYSKILSQAVLDEALKIFQNFSGEVTTINPMGDPAMEIITEAEEGNYDLIVMGCRGNGLFERMLGSVANKVLSNTDKAVLTI